MKRISIVLGLIHHKQASSNQEVQTKSYKSLTKQIQEFKKHLKNLHDQELKIQTADLADAEYTKWLQTRSFCSGMVTPQEYKDTATKYDPKVEVKIWRKADQFKSVKASFQKFRYLGTKRHSYFCSSNVMKFLKYPENIENNADFTWLLLFANSCEKLKSPAPALVKKLRILIEELQTVIYHVGFPSSSFKQTRELFQTFYRNMKFESLRLEPVVYECLISMAHHYSSGFHLLQASRNLSNEKSRNYREYSFTEEMMAYRNNLVLLVSGRCQEYIPAPCDDLEDEVSKIKFNLSVLDQDEPKDTKDMKNEQIDTELEGNITPDNAEEAKLNKESLPAAEDSISVSSFLAGKHYQFGGNKYHQYFHLEGYGLYKIHDNKVEAHSKSDGLLHGKLSFIFHNNADAPWIRIEDEELMQNIPFIKLKENLQIKEWAAEEIDQYQTQVSEYREEGIQPFEFTSSSVIYDNLANGEVRFMRSTPVTSDDTTIYALSSTVEVDASAVECLSKEELMSNTHKWVKKVLFWEIHGYEKQTLLHKFTKKFELSISENDKENNPKRLEEFRIIEEYAKHRLQLDTIKRAILSVKDDKVQICSQGRVLNFDLTSGMLFPTSCTISADIVGYCSNTKKYWHAEKLDKSYNLSLKACQLIVNVKNKIDYVQQAICNHIRSNVTKKNISIANSDHAETFEDILKESMHGQQEHEIPAESTEYYTDMYTASMIPLFKLANNSPEFEDKKIDFTESEAETYVMGRLYGSCSFFEISPEFHDEIMQSIVQIYQSLHERLESREILKSEESMLKINQEDIRYVEVYHHWIIRTHLLMRIYFFSIKNLLDAEIKPALSFESDDSMCKYFGIIGYLIEIQNFLSNCNLSKVLSYRAENRAFVRLDGADICEIESIIEANVSFIQLTKMYYYSLNIMNDMHPISCDGEDFDILKLLTRVNLEALKPHQNKSLNLLLDRFEGYTIEELQKLLVEDKSVLDKLKLLSEKISICCIITYSVHGLDFDAISLWLERIYTLLSKLLENEITKPVFEAYTTLLRVFEFYIIFKNSHTNLSKLSVTINDEFLKRVFSDIKAFLYKSSEVTNINKDKAQGCYEILVDIYFLIMHKIYSEQELSISKRIAQPGSWYDILDYHCINFKPTGDFGFQITGAQISEKPVCEYTEDHIIFEFIDKYLYSTEKEGYQNYPPMREIPKLLKIFSMHMSLLNYTENIEKLSIILKDLCNKKLYPKAYTIKDVAELKKVNYDEIKSERVLAEPILALLSTQPHFTFLTSLWKDLNLCYESYLPSEDIEQKYSLFMSFEFEPLSQSELQTRIHKLSEFNVLDTNEAILVDDLEDSTITEEIQEEIKEEIKEETKEAPQDYNSDWEAEEDQVFMNNFTNILGNINEPDEEVKEQRNPDEKPQVREDTRVFSGLETILQIRNAIKYFIVDTQSVEQIVRRLKAVHGENLKNMAVLERVTWLYDIKNLTENDKNKVDKWIQARMKTNVTYISRDYFLSCLKKPISEMAKNDKKNYSIFVAALLINSLKDDKTPVEQKTIRACLESSGTPLKENSLWMSLISDPYTFEKFDRGIWTDSISSVLQEIDDMAKTGKIKEINKPQENNPVPTEDNINDIFGLYDDDY
ncbi:unnamed protein product [Moneuplotes crassus]|uniref:Uncharacterized protein n=1 Tax=Euplotes crassus TaxID=5936 RepID=A0AAD2D817_EUPCR|nr:unnamed protein product [Moneuplotes crassus]